nr:hypothetical protein [Mycobacterium sp.]
MPDHVAGTVVEQREQHRPLALDDRAVQPVADAQLVGFVGLKPAERGHRLPGRAQMHLGGQLTHQTAALDRRQARIGQRPDQRIPVQRGVSLRSAASNSSMLRKEPCKQCL